MWQEWYLDDDGWDKHHIICWINGHIFIWFYLCAMSSAMVNWRGSIFDHGTRWRPWTPTTIFTSPQFWHVDLSLKVWISQAKIVENHVKNNVEPCWTNHIYCWINNISGNHQQKLGADDPGFSVESSHNGVHVALGFPMNTVSGCSGEIAGSDQILDWWINNTMLW